MLDTLYSVHSSCALLFVNHRNTRLTITSHLVITEMLNIIDRIYVINNYYYQVDLVIGTLDLMQDELEFTFKKIPHS